MNRSNDSTRTMQLDKFFIYAKNAEKGERVRHLVEERGFKYSSESPDFVITVGGDGTYLEAEHQMPGIPKLLVRDSLHCFKCLNEPLDKILEIVLSGEMGIQEIIKLEAIHPCGKLLAVNEIIVRNENPTRALRFKAIVDGEEIESNIIGDGIVVATPFGSTGYYQSVTRSTFSRGIGVAFNNSTEEKKPLAIGDRSELQVEITRENGQLAADNNPAIVRVGEGDKIVIRKAAEVARLVTYG